MIVGHDWGAPMAWNSAILYPDRYRAVVGMSVPYGPRPAAPPLQMLSQMFKDSFFYIVYFQDVGVAEAELDADPRRSMRLILYSASGDAPPAPGFAGKAKGLGLLDGMTDPADAALVADRSRPRLLRRRIQRAAASAAASTATATWTATGTNCRSSQARASSSPRCSSTAARTASSR